MVRQVHVLGLWCPRCGKQGYVFKIPESIQIRAAKPEFPHYRCQNCHSKRYDSGDVIALVVEVVTINAPKPSWIEGVYFGVGLVLFGLATYLWICG